MNSALKDLIEEISNSEEVIEFKRLEALVLNNLEIKETLTRLHEVEKQAVNAKEFGLVTAYDMYMKEYLNILSTFENDVLISSYIEAKKEVLDIVEMVTNIIQNEIAKKINN